VAVSVLLSGTGTLWADGIKIGDLYYKLDRTEKTAYVTYSTLAEPSSSQALPQTYPSLTAAIIPSTVTYSGEEYTVTAIGTWAFYYAAKLTEVTIPETVKTIGSSAFSSTKITTVTLPEDLAEIGSSAFSGCSELAHINIPQGIVALENNTFSGCSSLSEIVFPPVLQSVGERCFYGCTSLSDIAMPETVTSIGQYAFSGCTSLSSIVIPDGVETLPYWVFEKCTGLTEIVLGSGLNALNSTVFDGCTGVKRLIIRPGDTPIDLAPFTRFVNNTSYSYGTFYDLPLEEVVLDREIVSHDDVSGTDNVYHNPRKGVSNPFEEHPTLRRMIVGDNVRNIDKKLCRNCPNLEYVSLGKNVRSIGKNAFYLSTKIATIDAHMKIAPYLATADNVFSTQTYGADLNVPDGSSSDYRTAEVWKNFKYLGTVTDDDAAADGAVWKIRVPKGHVINLFMVKDDAHMQNLSLATDNADVAHVERVEDNPECHYIVPLAEGVAAITAYNADNKVVGRMQVEVSDDIQTGVPATTVRGYVPEIEADGLTVTVTGIEPGDNVAVFATDGRLVKYLQAESDRAVFRVGDDGTYLINVAGVTEKLYLHR